MPYRDSPEAMTDRMGWDRIAASTENLEERLRASPGELPHAGLLRSALAGAIVIQFGSKIAEGAPESITDDPAAQEAYLGEGM